VLGYRSRREVSACSGEGAPFFSQLIKRFKEITPAISHYRLMNIYFPITRGNTILKNHFGNRD